MDGYHIYWGETHDNTYQFESLTASMDEVLWRAASHLDFYSAAYYTACATAFTPGGHPSEAEEPKLVLEGWKSGDRLDQEWAEVQEATRAANRPGEFVTFPGYEWQGDGGSGDHNVSYAAEGPPIFVVDTLKQLYARLRQCGVESLAIPHHTAYRRGVRSRDWSVHDEELSPYTEIFSNHGCSETDEEWVGLRNNPHMGPGYAGGTWQDALDTGLRVGAIGSTDRWGIMPGDYGSGLMACIAKELTRESIWEAMKSRRVYAVTGDRIEIDFHIGNAMMGEVVNAAGPRKISVKVRGADAIDRIELLRRGRVIATHSHQGTWEMPPAGRPARFKIRVECGWGPRPTEIQMPERRWDCRLMVPGNEILGYDPCWISPGHKKPDIRSGTATFQMRTSQATVGARYQNANVFEIECDEGPDADLVLKVNELEERGTVAEFCRGSREMWFRDECVRTLHEKAGIEPESPERGDIYHHVAYKTKVHRCIPEAGYTAELEYEDDEPLAGLANPRGDVEYRVRVEQRNGQRAWSSPIWVSGG